MPIILTALALQAALTGLPGVSYGLSVESSQGPWLTRADAVYVPNARALVAMTAAYLWDEGGIQVGPILGLDMAFDTANLGPKSVGPGQTNQPNVLVGATLRWSNESFWLSASPNVNFIWLSPALTGGLQAPRPDLLPMIFGGPPLLEVGYKPTPRLGVALRASYLPLAISWEF
ncbi:MAG: hypothetical protein JWM80_4973 [Cyanobacteria bacterium RYN_339]|nr:hypothetical protein [Cyanobacteria bacterium RYN_339]